MNSFSHLQTGHRRQKRRLPHVQRPPRSRPSTFWPTYRGAVEWLRRNHGVMDTALELLEIYPSLIQEMSLDSLWHFVAPFATTAVKNSEALKRKNLTSTKAPNHASGNSRTSVHSISKGDSPPAGENKHTPEGKHIPVISITYASDDPEPELQALFQGDEDSLEMSMTPRVFVCGLCSNDMAREETQLHQHVVHALQHDFYVRSGPCSVADIVDPNPDELGEADVCVFVLDDSTLNTPACFRCLCAALAYSIPTVFVKNSEYSLPTPLPDVILRHNLGLESPDLSRASTPLRPSRSTSPDSKQRRNAGPMSSARASSATGFRSLKKASRRTRQESVQNTDMILHLLKGYRSALVFEEARHTDCEEEVRNAVHALLDAGSKEKRNIPEKDLTMSKSPNTLHPLSRKAGRSGHRRQKTFLGVPSVLANVSSCSKNDAEGFCNDDNDDDPDKILFSSTSEISVYFSSSSDVTRLSPENASPPHTQSNGHTSPTGSSNWTPLPPSSLIASVPTLNVVPPTPSPTPSNTRCSSHRSFHHLHHLQQQLQKDRASFLSTRSSSLTKEEDEAKSLEECKTTYLVCNRSKYSPNREPRLVKWPLAADEDMEQTQDEVETMSEEFLDSPTSFRDVDLSIVVNTPRRGSDTPDSDASTVF